MKKLIAQRYTIRHNFTAIICACLSLYFMWHALLGERSSFRLMMLDSQVASVEKEVGGLEAERSAIEAKVVRLRPGSLDPDMLEERARVVLGFNYPSETILLKP